MFNFRAILQGCGAQTIVFVLAVLSSAVIYPALGKYQEHAITLFTALGAACLAGDAIFHLIPHALNSGFHHEHGGITPDDHVILWRCLLMACSIYFFYLFHIYFHSQEGGHSHWHAISNGDNHENLELLQHDTEMSLLNCDTVKESKQPRSHEKKALLWMLMFGEILHTASDGLAIGAAFSSAAADGLSTSLAVLFHEIPNVTGAFAIFVSSGVSFRKALCLLSTFYLFSYVGVVVGAILGTSLNLTVWIFAVIAGMFLYIALAEMIPEMFISIASRTEKKRCFILLQNLGIILGFLIMMLLAAFEHEIRSALQTLE